MDSASGKRDAWKEELLPINKKVSSGGSTDDNADDNSLTDPSRDKVPLDESHQLTDSQAHQWRIAALALAWISVVVFLILGVTSFVVSASTESSAAFGFGFDCILDVFTSIVVIWRFHGSVKTLYSETRERIALLFLAGFFLIASFSILVRTITELVSFTHTTNEFSLCVLAAVSGTICAALATGKIIVAKKLDNKTVRSDGFSSLAGSVTAFSILVSARVITFNPDVWYLDNIVGFCVAALLMLYGIMLLVQVLSNDCIHGAGTCNCCCCKTTDSVKANTEK